MKLSGTFFSSHMLCSCEAKSIPEDNMGQNLMANRRKDIGAMKCIGDCLKDPPRLQKISQARRRLKLRPKEGRRRTRIKIFKGSKEAKLSKNWSCTGGRWSSWVGFL
ncbi:hypothetical protein K1719_013569 [Acacia pycnantha]|nr:hypothetical protein K1719_013569 [Acacia pycnantha]